MMCARYDKQLTIPMQKMSITIESVLPTVSGTLLFSTSEKLLKYIEVNLYLFYIFKEIFQVKS